MDRYETPVLKFYHGKNILITGATGFIGKVLLEKLLRSCHTLDHLYILIRPKKGLTVSQRLEKIIIMLKKIIAMEGDITKQNFGLNDENLETIKNHISIVFNAAATIRFNEELKCAIRFNVISVLNLINICKTIKNLTSLVHVSTAYSNCHLKFIDEKIYPLSTHPSKILDLLDWFDDDILMKITPNLIKGRPNTYTYTKAMAEQLLLENSENLPIVIIRPSIVGASWQEPIPGWIDNYNGPTGLLTAMGKGLLRIMRGNNFATADIIPVDISVNLMITLAWYIHNFKSNQILVINCTSGAINKLTWGEMGNFLNTSLNRTPLNGLFRTPNAYFTNNHQWFKLRVLLDHILPAYLIDTTRWLIGQEPVIIHLYEKIHKALSSLDYFTQHNWEFSNIGFSNLYKNLSKEDKSIFYLDIKTLEWNKYIDNYCLGAKSFLLNENICELKIAKSHYKKVPPYLDF
ncbi:unnamed protein product [Gordionus sp. m RMFG-2023]